MTGWGKWSGAAGKKEEGRREEKEKSKAKEVIKKIKV